MMRALSDKKPLDSLTSSDAASLAAELTEEFIARWRRGERPLVEDLLVPHTALWEHPEAVGELIYEEVCLRQEHGAEVPLEQVLDRFPQWRRQLAVLLDCHRLLSAQAPPALFPEAGESLGDFLLLSELGRGAQARVFVASQNSLADRPVVLKLIAAEVPEHLHLARLQHTHIVPLYSTQDHPARHVRALCMPYFGSITLGRLLQQLQAKPPSQRTGQDLVDVLDRDVAVVPLASGGPCPARHYLAHATYGAAIGWIGACLADALHYAHERGLIHLDLKPSNVLLATEGQPMLLDFHLAQEPVPVGAQYLASLGGTAGYMSPEQQAAVQAVQAGRLIERAVDRRSDIYSLGVVLYEALSGRLPSQGMGPPLYVSQPWVSRGLSDIISRCLALEPKDRYQNMADLAADLHRHLAHLPLAGVRNRSLAERWRKWRRRRPHGLAMMGMTLSVGLAASAVLIAAVAHVQDLRDQAHAALEEGQAQLANGQWTAAVQSLERGLSAAQRLPLQTRLTSRLERSLHLAEHGEIEVHRAAAAKELHQLADRVRFCGGADSLAGEMHKAKQECETFWKKRGRLVNGLRRPLTGSLEPGTREDLFELFLFWADVQVQLASPASQVVARQRALKVLDEAEALLGASPVLDTERQRFGAASASSPASGTAWEHYALARAYLRAGELARATREADCAVTLQPQGLWPNYYTGLCAYRESRYADAVTAFSVCIGAAPQAASCFYNRAVALAGLGRTRQALADYGQALRLDPSCAAAALNRGMLYYQAKNHTAALADLSRARALGAEPAVVSFDLALVHLASMNEAAALEDLKDCLRYQSCPPRARQFYQQLLRRVQRSHPEVPAPAGRAPH